MTEEDIALGNLKKAAITYQKAVDAMGNWDFKAYREAEYYLHNAAVNYGKIVSRTEERNG
jgi:hypothetical protein